MKILVIIIMLLALSFSIINANELSGKFILPSDFPHNYYVEKFEEKGVVYHEIVPTFLDWLVILIVRKPDIKDWNNYSDSLTFLLDNRNGQKDKRSRMIMIIHEKEKKLFFSAIDKTYIDDHLGIDETSDWHELTYKIENLNNSKLFLGNVIMTLIKEEQKIKKSQI